MNNDRVKINLNSVEDIKKFIKVVTNFEEDIDIISGRFVIDAKSIMGVFALDLSKPVEAQIITEDPKAIDKFTDAMKDFQV